MKIKQNGNAILTRINENAYLISLDMGSFYHRITTVSGTEKEAIEKFNKIIR